MGPKSKHVSAEDIEQAVKGLRQLLGAVERGELGAKGSPESRRFVHYVQGSLAALESLLEASQRPKPSERKEP